MFLAIENCPLLIVLDIEAILHYSCPDLRLLASNNLELAEILM